MNQLTHARAASTSDALFLPSRRALHATHASVLPEVAEARFALRVAAALSESSAELDVDVGERLRFARELALERARSRQAVAVAATGVGAVGITRGGAAVLGSFGSQWWGRLALVLPVVVLLGGLLAISHWQDGVQISAAAEVDLPLLADELPPAAYSDAGFAEFVKTPRQ